MVVTPQGTIQLQYSWGDPYGGTAVDAFSIDSSGRLQLHTIATVEGKAVEYCQVYNRKK